MKIHTKSMAQAGWLCAAILSVIACVQVDRLTAETSATSAATSTSTATHPIAASASPAIAASHTSDDLQRLVALREYHASPNDQGLQAPNRRHNLRTYFEPEGIRVHDRTSPGSPELVALSLAGLGRSDALAPVALGEVRHAGPRVEIARPGLVEWYENGERGLEQGFTLAERPAGDGELVLSLDVARATVSQRGKSEAVFTTTRGRKLGYDELIVVDADGDRLDARIEVPDEKTLRLVVADAGADYPITIDPLIGETADTVLQPEQVADRFGFSLDFAGDFNGDGFDDVIVGALFYDSGQVNEGAAFLFFGNALGIADATPAQAGVRFESDQANAQFGRSVSGVGDFNGDGFDDVVISAGAYDAGQIDEGAVFLFLGSAAPTDGNPSNAAARFESNLASAGFGIDAAGAGDVNGDGLGDVLVGANDYGANQQEGTAFLFLGSPAPSNGDPTTAATRIEAGQAGANLGFSVAGAGDVNGDGFDDILVGAPLYTIAGGVPPNSGAAFLFLGSPTGIADGNPSTAATRLEGVAEVSLFGVDVAGAGDVDGDGFADILVASHTRFGYLYHGSATGIAHGGPASADTQIESDQLLNDVTKVSGLGDVNGDGYSDVAFGIPGYAVSGGPSTLGNAGAAFVFHGSAAGIQSGTVASANAVLRGSSDESHHGDRLGGSGDVNGDGYDDVLVGASFIEQPSVIGVGVAFIYHGGAEGIRDADPTNAAASIEGGQAGANLGASVSSAGDVNGDGFSDVLVSAELYDAGEADEGAAFIFHGGPLGIASVDPASAATQIESNQTNAQLGGSVASAGDVNGDGFGDVVVGVQLFDAPSVNEGAALLFLGSATGIADGNPTTADAVLESNQSSAQFGSHVASAGDVDGDGYGDLIVGSLLYDSGEQNEGAVFIYSGGPTGIADGGPSTAATFIQGDQVEARLAAVAGAGDVDGDGYADVILGGQNFDWQVTDQGFALVYRGGPLGVASGNPATAATLIHGTGPDSGLGAAVAGIGDVDGDGFGDVAIGAPREEFSVTDEGLVFVFHGSATGIDGGASSTADSRIEGGQVGAGLGQSIGAAGDVDGDGFADLIVGAPFYDSLATDSGAAFILTGSPVGLAIGDAADNGAQIVSDQSGARMGTAVAGLGDVNGDGFADVIAASPLADATVGAATDVGAALIQLGNGNTLGRPVLARQRRGDGSGVGVQPWGVSGEDGEWDVSVRATHPAGRGRVKLEVQSCPAGRRFGDVQCSSATGAQWTDVTASSGGVELVESLVGLDATLYHWRARVLYAPFNVIQPGITEPSFPSHGPWRRVGAQAVEADIRAVPEPGLAIAIALGCSWLAVGHERRWRRRAEACSGRGPRP